MPALGNVYTNFVLTYLGFQVTSIYLLQESDEKFTCVTDRQIDRQTNMDGRPVMWHCMRRHMTTVTSKPDDSVPDC